MVIFFVVAVIIGIILYLLLTFIRDTFFSKRPSANELGFGYSGLQNRISENDSQFLKAMLYFGAAVIMLAFVLSLTFAFAYSSPSCGTACHSMNSAYQSWRRSSHAAVPCIACHQSGNLLASAVNKIGAGGNVYKELTGSYRRPINRDNSYGQKYMFNSACLKCHSPGKRKFTARQGLNITSKVHVKHLDAKLKCVTCHNRVAHPDEIKYQSISVKYKNFSYKNYLRMKTGCWRCHKKGGVFKTSSGKKVTGPYLAPNGARAPTACKTCHNPDWNHKPAMHKKNKKGYPWSRGLNHGPVARKNFQACLGCHDSKTWCSTKCHKGVTMPHIANWRQVHPVWAKANRKLCDMCHKADKTLQFCGDRCHHDSFREKYKLTKKKHWRNGKEQHGVVVKANQGKPCFRCHDQKTWCTTQCHKGITMPHKLPEWRKIHFTFITKKPYPGNPRWHLWDYKSAVCNMCHNKNGDNSYYCFNCHHKEFYDAWPRLKKGSMMSLMQNAWRNLGTTRGLAHTKRCAKCHTIFGFCTMCHGPKRPRKRN